jgi:hypothetical protein
MGIKPFRASVEDVTERPELPSTCRPFGPGFLISLHSPPSRAGLLHFASARLASQSAADNIMQADQAHALTITINDGQYVNL